jgi:hypothetical protein
VFPLCIRKVGQADLLPSLHEESRRTLNFGNLFFLSGAEGLVPSFASGSHVLTTAQVQV